MAGGVTISPNIKRTKESIDVNGNKVVPFTKQIIEKNEPAYVPTPEEINKSVAKTPEPIPAHPDATMDSMTILEQIEKTKKQLKDLEELKRLEIEKKKKELELLQQ